MTTTLVQDFVSEFSDMYTVSEKALQYVRSLKFPGTKKLAPFAKTIESLWRQTVIEEGEFGEAYLCYVMYHTKATNFKEWMLFERAMEEALDGATFLNTALSSLNRLYYPTIVKNIGDHITEILKEGDEDDYGESKERFIWTLVRAVWIEKLFETKVD